MARQVAVTLVKMGWQTQIQFTLTCADQTHFTEHQDFEIVSPDCESVTGKLLQVVNRSDGTTSVRMIASERDRDVNLRRLRVLPNVSNIQAA